MTVPFAAAVGVAVGYALAIIPLLVIFLVIIGLGVAERHETIEPVEPGEE